MKINHGSYLNSSIEKVIVDFTKVCMYSVYMLKRMQILIDTETKYLVEQKAKRDGKSVSETIRKCLQKELIIPTSKKRDGYEVLMGMAKNSVRGPKSGINIDKIVYDL